MDLDINFVRNQFPAFSENSLKGKAFFENAGGSYACGQVINRLNRFYKEKKVQPYGAFEASISGGNEMDEARVGLARYLGVKDCEVSFGPSTTQNTYVLAQAFAEWLVPGNAIIVTNQDHEANTGSWRRLSNRGVNVREWQVNKETGELNLEDLENLLDDNVKLVCFPHCSNIVAHINPVKEIVSRVHSAGGYVCVDGVSYAPHGLPNVEDLGADIYLFSSYKTYGPHQGIMVIKEKLAELLPNQGHYFNEKFLTKKFTASSVVLTSTSFSTVIVFNSSINFLTIDFIVSSASLSNLITASSLFLNSGGKNFLSALSSSPSLSKDPKPILFLSIASAPKLEVRISVIFLQSAFLPFDPVTVP